MLRRRRFLVLAGVTAGVGLAGCADAEAEFLVTNVQRVHRSGDDRFEYPEDVLYWVSIENTGPEREEGRLELTLVYDPSDGGRETWSKTDDISLARGSSVRREYVFEGVFEESNDIEDYRLEAEIVQDADE